MDIILYAVVAVVILARLWSTLGQRSDTDIERPNPFVAKKPDPTQNPPDEDGAAPANEENSPVIRMTGLAPASLAGGLAQIRSRDPQFDEAKFLQGARAAFTIIVEEYFKGDLEKTTPLVGAEVLANFKKSIESRRDAGQVMQGRVVRITAADAIAARMEDARAYITVEFTSEQETVLYNQTGQVIGGEVGKVEQVTDIWVFTRDLTSPNPNWQLVETKA